MTVGRSGNVHLVFFIYLFYSPCPAVPSRCCAGSTWRLTRSLAGPTVSLAVCPSWRCACGWPWASGQAGGHDLNHLKIISDGLS